LTLAKDQLTVYEWHSLFWEKAFAHWRKKANFICDGSQKKKEIDATILLANDSVYVASMTMFFFLFGTICFSQIHQPRTMHIKFAQRHCNVHAQT
jgi:hypothetical protein